jgi:hypothetical protein
MIKVTVRKAKPKSLPWLEKGKLLGNNYILIIVEVYIEVTRVFVDRTIISSKNKKKVISEKAIMDILLDEKRPTYNSVDVTHFAKDLENEVIYFLPLDYYYLIDVDKVIYYYE